MHREIGEKKKSKDCLLSLKEGIRVNIVVYSDSVTFQYFSCLGFDFVIGYW